MADKRTKDLTEETTVLSTDFTVIDRPGWPESKKVTVANYTALEAAARAAQDNVIEASAGLSTAGAYDTTATSSTDTWYLRSADFTAGTTGRGGATGALTPSLKAADRLLDGKLYNTINRVSALENAYYSTYIDITHANILQLNATPQTIIDISALGTFRTTAAIDVVAWECYLYQAAGTVTAYATNTTLELYIDTATKPLGQDQKILLSTANRAAKSELLDSSTLSLTTDTQLIKNKDLMIRVASGNPTAGNANNVLRVFVTCRIIDLT